MKTTITHTLVGVATLSLVLAARPGRADEAQPDRAQVKAQVEQTLQAEGKMSPTAVAKMSGEIDRHTGDKGYGPAVSAAVQDALAKGCTGTCLAEAVHQVNHAMDRGRSAEEAQELVGKAVADASGTEAQRRDHVRRQVDTSLRGQSADRTHDRAGDMGHGAGHGGDMSGGMTHGMGR
jgi:hypothetical protein